MELRVAAGQIEPADARRQGGILQGTEENRLGPGALQRLQRFGVGKAERFVLRHGNFDLRRRLVSRLRRRGGPFAEGQQAGPIEGVRRCIGQEGKLLL